ncbi:LysE family transporter [Gymnodinialimonas sp. 2305UL16-5]|uniref:LysE family translocator n=1 Tax=Gymnodinialimonas mytili TaxID=3126503 RepID=UPI0030B44885
MISEFYIAYLATVAVFFASPPGPSQLLMISNALRHGLRRSSWTMAGDLSANALQMLAAGFGLAALIATTDWALDVIKWAGVAYLIWMGIRTFRAPPATARTADAAAHPRRLFLQGFLTSASNPKAVFFFAALFPQFISQSAPILPQLLILGITYLVIDGVILLIYGMTATRLFARLATRGRLLNRLSGSLMIGAAILLALRDARAR